MIPYTENIFLSRSLKQRLERLVNCIAYSVERALQLQSQEEEPALLDHTTAAFAQ